MKKEYTDFSTIKSTSTHVIEECSELIHAICKADRFGYDESHPDKLDRQNYQDIRDEVRDVEKCLKAYKKHLKVCAEEM
jgi:NTP pyrophosphatase (non-canonical NTP hydrolase)